MNPAQLELCVYSDKEGIYSAHPPPGGQTWDLCLENSLDLCSPYEETPLEGSPVQENAPFMLLLA